MFGHPSEILKEALYKLPNALELTENKLGELRSDSKITRKIAATVKILTQVLVKISESTPGGVKLPSSGHFFGVEVCASE